MAGAYLALDECEKAAESDVALLGAFPDYEEAYKAAHRCYHERLFAIDLTEGWLARHPGDFSVRMNFAECHFTTGRYTDAEARLAVLLAKTGLEPRPAIVLQALEIATLLAQGNGGAIPAKLVKLKERISAQPEDFTTGWTFFGSTHFISEHPELASHPWLADLLTALEGQDRKGDVGRYRGRALSSFLARRCPPIAATAARCAAAHPRLTTWNRFAPFSQSPKSLPAASASL